MVDLSYIILPADFDEADKFVAEVVKRTHAKDLRERIIDEAEELLLKALEEPEEPFLKFPIKGFQTHEQIGMGVINMNGIKKLELTTSSRKMKTKWSPQPTFKTEVLGVFHDPTDVRDSDT